MELRSGERALSSSTAGTHIDFDLTGLDPACAGGADVAVSANSCKPLGLHMRMHCPLF